jgi:hypothetical protein
MRASEEGKNQYANASWTWVRAAPMPRRWSVNLRWVLAGFVHLDPEKECQVTSFRGVSETHVEPSLRGYVDGGLGQCPYVTILCISKLAHYEFAFN